MLLKFSLGEFSLLVERIDHLAEELVVDDAAVGTGLYVGLRVLQERVELLVLGHRCLLLVVHSWSRHHYHRVMDRLCVIPQHIELQEACK